MTTKLLAAFIITVSCPRVTTINNTDQPWDTRDNQNLVGVVTGARCAHNKPSLPCVYSFTKLREDEDKVRYYHTGCGAFEVTID